MDSKSGIITSVMTIVAPTKIERYSNQNLENSRKYLKIKPSGRLAFFFFLAFFLTILLNSPILSLNRRIIFITLYQIYKIKNA